MKKPKEQSKFQTHIKEPKWQIILSVIVVVVVLAIEILFVLKIL